MKTKSGFLTISMVNLSYPYGKPQVYLGGSSLTVAARFIKMGHKVNQVDLNIENLDDSQTVNKLRESDILALSIIGAPYIPGAIKFAKQFGRDFSPFAKQILIGGQVIEQLEPEQFNRLFSGTSAIQIRNDHDLANVLQCSTENIPQAYEIPISLALEQMKKEALKEYLSHEMTLIVSQGCLYQCAFCAAKKEQREKFKTLPCFSDDLRYLMIKAKELGIEKLEFYATSLDFFQNPIIIIAYLRQVAKLQKEEGVKVKIRCLSCVKSFLKAIHMLGQTTLTKVLQEAGLWCVGFGVDGADEKVWQAQKKGQNHLSEVKDCLDISAKMRIRAEILLVMGFPQDTFTTLSKCIRDSIFYTKHWSHTMLRPYLAKEYVPGNDSWKLNNKSVELFIANPKKFYNIDFCAIASRSTDSRRWHRWYSNFAYLAIIALLTPFKRCVTSPLLPQGNTGLYGKTAEFINRIMPFDR